MDFLSAQAITAPLAGFAVTKLPLWELSYILDEEWVHEDCANAISEMTYFKKAVLSHDHPPKFIFLPTTFYDQAYALFSRGLPYSPNILTLRRRVVATGVNAIGFLILNENHFTAVWVDRHGISYADSLERGPGEAQYPAHLQLLLSWVFRETPFRVSREVTVIDVPKQTATSGRGSCGIAALNFVIRHAIDNTTQWSPVRSHQFRQSAISELLDYHIVAAQRTDVGYLLSTSMCIDCLT